MGLEVTIVEMAERVLARVTGEVMSQFYEEMHRHNSYSRAVECKKRAAIQSVNCVGYFVMVGTNHRGRAEKTPDWRAGTFSNQAYAFESHSLGAIRH